MNKNKIYLSMVLVVAFLLINSVSVSSKSFTDKEEGCCLNPNNERYCFIDNNYPGYKVPFFRCCRETIAADFGYNGPNSYNACSDASKNWFIEGISCDDYSNEDVAECHPRNKGCCCESDGGGAIGAGLMYPMQCHTTRYPGSSFKLLTKSSCDLECACVDKDGDGHEVHNELCPTGTDCDDADYGVNSDVAEVCNNIDDNCNGLIDETLSIECFSDSDCKADGCYDGTYYNYYCIKGGTCFSYCDRTAIITDYDRDGYDIECDADCDDNNANVYPGATEVYDRLDNDCDNILDEGFCSDGTPRGKCSEIKPKYCQRGNLIDMCSECGCPSGQECQFDDSCSSTGQRCSDRTPYGECSEIKPKYCDRGNLIDRCSECGCPSGQECQSDGACLSYNLKSAFLKDDPRARAIIEGVDYQLSDTNYLTTDGKINAVGFEFKLINAFRQLGYTRLTYNIIPGSSKSTVAFYKWQIQNGFQTSDILNREKLILIDEQLFDREKIDNETAQKYIPYSKFVNGPENEPSKEHVAMIYYNLFSSLPDTIRARLWRNSIRDTDHYQSVMTLEEFSSFINTYKGYFGVLIDKDTRNILTSGEVETMVDSDVYNFEFCAGGYYARMNRENCDIIDSLFLGSISSDFNRAATLAHEFGHGVGAHMMVIDGDSKMTDEHFGKISFNMTPSNMVALRTENDEEFVSDYAKYNYAEDFAESFSAYMHVGKIFRERAKNNPYLNEKYNFLKNYVFGGQEYDTGNLDSYNVWLGENKSLPPYAEGYMLTDLNWEWDYEYNLVGFCSDGTPLGECSEIKPKYCENGELIDRCSECGCPTGQECLSDGRCSVITKKIKLTCLDRYETKWHFGKCRKCREGYVRVDCIKRGLFFLTIKKEICERTFQTRCLENPSCGRFRILKSERCEEPENAPTLNLWIRPSTNNTYINNAYNITANITDYTAVDTVLVDFNGTNYTMSSSSDLWFYSWDTTKNSDGEYNITLYYNDTFGNSGTDTIYNTTVDNTPPNVLSFNGNVIDNANLSGTNTINATINDALQTVDSVIFRLINSSGDYILDSTASNINDYWTASLNTNNYADGYYDIPVFANDTSGNINNTEMIQVKFDNTAPAIQNETRTPSTVYNTLNVTINATVLDNTSISSVWLYGTWFNSSGANYTVTSSGDIYTYTIYSGNLSNQETVYYRWFADDTLGNSATGTLQSFTVENRAPTVDPIGNKEVNETQTIIFDVVATDPDGDVLTFFAYNLSEGAIFSNQRFNWTPGYEQAGKHNVTFVVSDGILNDSEEIIITVYDVNRAPNASIKEPNNNLTFNLSDEITFNGELSYDIDNDPLIYLWDFGDNNTATGETTAHNYTQPGTYTVKLTVSDAQLNDTDSILVNIEELLPDLIIENVSWEPKEPVVGNLIEFTIPVKNIGEAATTSITFTFAESWGGGGGGSQLILQPGQSHNFTHTHNSSQTENYTVTFTVTPTPSDINSSNNNVTITINISEETLLQAELTVATLKDRYWVEEQINLTDPPEEEPREEHLKSNSYFIEGALPEKDVEIEGYIVQLKEKPIVEREIEIKKELRELEESSVSYERKSKKGFLLLRPYYKFQEVNKKGKFIEVNRDSATRIGNSRKNIEKEHKEFLDSVGDIVVTNNMVTGRVVDDVSVAVNLSDNIKREFDYIFNGFVLDISEQEAKEIERLDEVKKVYPNYQVEALLDSSIPAMNFDLADAGLNGEGITIAVIDTGIDAGHESLDDLDDDANTDDQKVIGWMDYVNFRAEPYDDHGHGTHCSGIAAGTGGSSDYIGVAPKANLVGVKVLDSYGSGSFSDVIAGIEWVVQHREEYNISIISMSLGADINSDGTTPVEIAADYAVENGINFVVAAGNNGPGENTVGIPASAFNVVTVGAVDDDLELAGFSSRGPTKDRRIKPEVTAVGVDVTSSTPGNNYEEWSGTSMATPHVAGFVALLLQQNPSLTAGEVKDLLMQTAIDKGVAGPDNDYGYGVVNGLETIFTINPPEHEISLVDLGIGSYLVLNEENEIKAKIRNYGLNDEDTEVKFFVDDIEIESKNILLLSKEAKEVVFDYTEDREGEHELKVKVVNIPEEEILENNELTKEVYAVIVLGNVKAVVVDSWGNHKAEYTIFDDLNENWFNYGDYSIEIDYTTLKKEDITYEDIAATNADVLILSDAWANGHYGMYLEYTDSEIQAIKRYVEEGHGLIGTSGTFSELVGNNIKLAELFGIKDKIGLWNDYEAANGGALRGKNMNILAEDDILTRNLPTIYMPYPGTVLNLELNGSTGVVRVAEAEHREDIFVSAYKPGLGTSVYFTIFPEYYEATENDKQFFYNSLLWTKENTGDVTKDIAIYDFQVPKRATLNEEISISAKVKNNGQSSESDISINLVIDGVINETKTISLDISQETEVNFSFISGEVKEYEISLEAVPLSGETYLINNKLKTFLLVPDVLLNGDNTAYLIDIGDDGKYDYLAVSIGIDVFESGTYEVSFDLESFLGVSLYNAYEWSSLSKDDNNITILVPLQWIKKFELDGPYKIKNIEIEKEGKLLDSNKDGFVTDAYNYNEFADPARIILDSFSDYGLDENSNNLYDYLVVSFNVSLPVPGDYNIYGALADLYLHSSTGLGVSEPGIHEAILKFDGIGIRKSRLDGPYYLNKVRIYSQFLEDEVEDAYTTSAYSYMEFENLTNIRMGLYWGNYLVVGEDNEIMVPIYNTGSEDVGSFNVSLFFLEGEERTLIDTITVDEIKADSFENVIFNYTPAKSGWLSFEVKADIDDDIPEDNIRKSSIKSYLEVGADLSIYPYIWDKDFIIDEESEIEFNVYNQGLEEAENIVVGFYSIEEYYNGTEWIENLTLIGSKNLGNLEVYGKIEDSFDYTPTPKYNYLLLIVEADNEVFPGDNKEYMHIKAKVRGADVRGYVWYTGLNFVVDKNNLIKMVAENVGTETADNVVVSLYEVKEEYYDGNGWVQNLSLVDKQEFGELKAKDSIDLAFTYVPSEELIGKVNYLLIETNSSNDVNEENNENRFRVKVVPQSKIVNNEDFDLVGYLTIKIEKQVNNTWQDYQTIIDDFSANIGRSVPSHDLIKLDHIFNPENIKINESGGYRINAEFKDENNEIIKTKDGELNASWEFSVR